MRIGQRERVIIELAVETLRKAALAADSGPVDTLATRLALRCLLPHCPERWPLVCFWESSSQSNEIGRTQGTTAALNGILLQLRKAGALPR